MTDLATHPTGELLYVDPSTLLLGDNVRLDPRLDKGFIGSIRERGVLEPIAVYRDVNGELVVLRGKRRTLAAVEAARPVVPVVVVPPPDDADRLVDQVVENEQRAGLTTRERVAAFEQLSAFGLSAAQIARRTGAKRTDVAAAIRVAGSDEAKKVVQRHDFLAVDQAAVVAEFEDQPAAVKQLVQAAKDGRDFNHTAQRLRDDRAEATAVAKATEALTAAGVKVVDQPGYGGNTKRLADLLDGTDPLTVKTHAACPGHAAYITHRWIAPQGGDESDPAATVQTDVVYVCTNYKKHQHTYRYAPARPGQPAPGADPEAATAERRDVIASNRAWASAETVRRQWLRQFAARKTTPKGAAVFIADALARCGHPLTDALSGGHTFAHELLGLTKSGYDDENTALAGLLAGAGEARAQMLTLTLILAGYEAATSRDSWRYVKAWTGRYLRYLQSQGYELSDIERRACGEQPSPGGSDGQ